MFFESCRRAALVCAVGLVVFGLPAVVLARGRAHGQAARKTTIAVHPAESSIRIDGVLDEPAWRDAASVELAWETTPGDNVPAPVKTECLVTYDARSIFLAFRAQDPDPSQIRAHLTDRDAAFDDDFVGVILDTFHDSRRGFEFFVNPLGVQMDLINNDVGGGEDSSWDAIWASAGRVTPGGYVVEMEIPFSSLRFPHGSGVQTWGFSALRIYPRDRRYVLSSQPEDRNISCELCQISELTGLEGIRAGHALELDPTFTSTTTQVRDDFPDGPLSDPSVRGNTGLTVRWGMTPNLVLSGTVNPDFSQVEADAAQLSINRTFALFFPEKRPFFLEGSDYFQTPVNLVHTRTVADPSWGVKLTGKAGPNAIGAFVADDDVTSIIFPGNQGSESTSLDQSSTTAVVRYRRDVGASSTLGAIVTSREGKGNYSNQVYGVDGLLRLSETDDLSFQALGSETEYPRAVAEEFSQPAGQFNGSAIVARYSHDSRNWKWDIRYQDLGRGFRADVGFEPQVDTRFVRARASHVWWGDDGAFFNRLELGANRDETRDHDGVDLDRTSEVWVAASGPWQSHGFINIGTSDTYFNGRTFDQDYVGIFFNARPSGTLSVGAWTRLGDTIDFANTRSADGLTFSPRVTVKLGRHLRTDLRHTYQRLHVDGGRLFRANLTDLRLVYQFNVRTFVRLISQYTDIIRNPSLYESEVDPTSRQLFNQLLFSYKVNPQTVFFLGYSDSGFGRRGIDITTTNRTIFLKVGYAWLL